MDDHHANPAEVLTITGMRDAPPATGRGARRIGLALKTIVVLFLGFDALIKIVFLPDMPEAAASLGWNAAQAPTLGFVLLVSTLLYALPRTALLGGVLLTAYLGGAVATHMRVESPVFTHTLFGVYLGLIVWAALFLCDRRLLPLLRRDRMR